MKARVTVRAKYCALLGLRVDTDYWVQEEEHISGNRIFRINTDRKKNIAILEAWCDTIVEAKLESRTADTTS